MLEQVHIANVGSTFIRPRFVVHDGGTTVEPLLSPSGVGMASVIGRRAISHGGSCARRRVISMLYLSRDSRPSRVVHCQTATASSKHTGA